VEGEYQISNGLILVLRARASIRKLLLQKKLEFTLSERFDSLNAATAASRQCASDGVQIKRQLIAMIPEAAVRALLAGTNLRLLTTDTYGYPTYEAPGTPCKSYSRDTASTLV
jgi:hypothetical protein